MPAHGRLAPRSAPIRVAIAGYAVISLIAVLVVMTGALEQSDRAILAQQFAALRAFHPRAAAHDVVLVGIDDESVKRLPEPIALWHPHFSRFLRATVLGGAAGVGLDVVFPDRSYDVIAPGYDRQLLVGIIAARRAAPLILARTVAPDGRPRTLHPLFAAAAGAESIAYALLPVDSDGVVRRFDERLGSGEERVATLAGALAHRLGAPLQSGLIDYSRGAAFAYVPLHRILELYDAGDTTALRAIFDGKPVLLGGVFKFEDHLSAPVNLTDWDPDNSTVPGVVLHAQALRNLLDGTLIASVPWWVTLALCLLGAAVWWLATTLRRALLAIVIGFVIVASASTALLERGFYLPPSALFAVVFLGAAGRTALEAARGMHERLKLRRAFSGYVSPGVMDDILGGGIAAELGGVNRFVCALFSDIRGYTTRSEGMSPQEIVSFLNSYFEQVVNLIHARGGTVVTFMGDGIMAIFGAPKTLGNPCAEAFEASRELLQYVQAFNARARAAGEAPINVGIGLHAGEVVVGHVGSSTRHDYTAIGDVINVASRLEGVTKDVGYRLVYSKIVADALAGDPGAAHLGPQQLKGHTPVDAYGFDRIA